MVLTAHYRFNEAFESTAYDYVGGYNGIIDGCSINQTGINGSSFAFDLNDRVHNLGTPMPTGNDPRSISLWVWKDNFAINGNIPLFRAGANLSGQDASFTLVLNTDKAFIYMRRFSQDNQSQYFFNLINNSWNHIVITYDGTSTWNLKYYVNNIDCGNEHIGSDVTLSTATTTQQIGINYSHTSFTGKVKIDEVKIYSHALTISEIFELYKEFDKTYTAGEANLKTNYPERIEEPYILIPEISNVFEKDKVGI